jgi:hypothetical protein
MTYDQKMDLRLLWSESKLTGDFPCLRPLRKAETKDNRKRIGIYTRCHGVTRVSS